VSTPLRPRKKGGATAETPVQRYLDYIEAGGLPSPVSSFDSQPTRKFKDWFRKEFEEEPYFNEIKTIYDEDIPRHHGKHLRLYMNLLRLPHHWRLRETVGA